MKKGRNSAPRTRSKLEARERRRVELVKVRLCDWAAAWLFLSDRRHPSSRDPEARHDGYERHDRLGTEISDKAECP